MADQVPVNNQYNGLQDAGSGGYYGQPSTYPSFQAGSGGYYGQPSTYPSFQAYPQESYGQRGGYYPYPIDQGYRGGYIPNDQYGYYPSYKGLNPDGSDLYRYHQPEENQYLGPYGYYYKSDRNGVKRGRF